MKSVLYYLIGLKVCRFVVVVVVVVIVVVVVVVVVLFVADPCLESQFDARSSHPMCTASVGVVVIL